MAVMSTQSGGRGESEPGHYELRDHVAIGGLIDIVWCGDGQPASVMVTISTGRLAALAAAVDKYIAHHGVVGGAA
jgi:hypothetical protein